MIKKIFSPLVAIGMTLLIAVNPSVPIVTAAAVNVTFTVDTPQDEIDNDTSDGVCQINHCSLRAAIMQANHLRSAGVTTIRVPAGLYTLTRPKNGSDGEDNGDLNLTPPLNPDQSIVINGAGAANTIIDANQIDGVINIMKNRVSAISGVTIRNGNRLPASSGGGIITEGTLTITDCIIEGNKAGNVGGAISSSNNLTIVRSTIRSNVTLGYGGGLYVAGPTTIRDSTISANGADFGGGIYNNNGTLYLTNSTISQNYANTNGGGVNARFASTTGLYNTSVIDNDADHDRDQLGGIGGGVYNLTGSRFIVVNALITRNTLVNSPIYDDCNGTLEAYGKNLFGDLTGCTIPNSLNTGSTLITAIGPLQNNGGTTWTHALLPNSDAINNTFDNLGCVDETGAPLKTDQRGFQRPVGPRCDVGAYEYNPAITINLPLVLK